MTNATLNSVMVNGDLVLRCEDSVIPCTFENNNVTIHCNTWIDLFRLIKLLSSSNKISPFIGLFKKSRRITLHSRNPFIKLLNIFI